MGYKILDGRWLSQCFQVEIKTRVDKLRVDRGRAPGLGVILVGDNPASQAYVANKEKLAKNCGLETFDHRLPVDASKAQVADAIHSFNEDPRVDGILLQLPLPKHLHADEFLDLIDPRKDADGLTPVNQGLLMRGAECYRPCTPRGALSLIDLAFSEAEAAGDPRAPSTFLKPVSLAGKRAVVIGRSILVGKPLALLLLERGATVTIAHSKTNDLPGVSREADIVLAAVGVPHLVKKEFIRPGAVVIDVGINRVPSGKLVGDVAFEEVAPLTSAITPVPRGVGPMTVVMLILNTVDAMERQSA